tara:strand:- start:86 stop:868 length:783 start_codon:yes stop_codon:yes gene_type:complete
MYGGFLDIIDSKKILIFVGSNRADNINVAISCLEYLTLNYFFDSYDVVVTDNDKNLINYLQKNKINFYKKNKIDKIINNTDKIDYDWLLNIWGHSVFPINFLNKFNNNLNIHPSYLPYGKGKDSSLWTVVNNYPAGTTLHKMTNKLDGGPIFCQKRFDFSFPTTGNDIYKRSLRDSVSLFTKNWTRIRNLKMQPKKQKLNNVKTYYRSKMLKENLVDLDDNKNKKIKEFIIKSLAHNFFPNFNIKIKFNKKIFNFRSLIS